LFGRIEIGKREREKRELGGECDISLVWFVLREERKREKTWDPRTFLVLHNL
jgi:hypothetical protein